MRKVTLSLIAATIAASATPAMANNENFEGPRAEILAGYELIEASALPTSEDGAAFALVAGYDHDAGPVLVGVEAEISDSSTDRNLVPGVDVETGRTIYGGVRIGAAVSSKAMVYVKGGYANSELRVTNGSNTLFVTELDGIRGGAGVEYKLNDNMHVKGEYRYTNYSDTVSSHQAMAGIGIRF